MTGGLCDHVRFCAAVSLSTLALGAFAQGQPPLRALDAAGRALVAARCAHPQEVKTSQVMGTADQMQAIDCRSFRLALYLAYAGGGRSHESAMGLVVTARGPALPAGFAVGMAAADVPRLLGPPTVAHAHSLRYLLDASRPTGDSITFEIRAAQVQTIAWNWRVD